MKLYEGKQEKLHINTDAHKKNSRRIMREGKV